jgi:pyruvate dehydrogenase E2 component (dihydrolipoamide acetyltransferase)
MAYEFKLPDLGEGLTEGEIVEWLVKEGDSVEEDQVFVKVETDKAVLEIPSPRKGMVLRIGAAEGDTVQVGEVILVIGEEGEKPEPVTKPVEAEKPRSVGVVGVLEEAPEEAEVREGGGRAEITPAPPGKRVEVLAMPAVRKLARELNVDLTYRRPRGKRRKSLLRKPLRRHENTICTVMLIGCSCAGCERPLPGQW